MARSYKSKHSSVWIHLLLIFACVGFPAIVTAIAPVCVTRFMRAGGVVTAVVQTRLFFLIPYCIARVEDVKGVDESQIAGTLVTDQSPRDNRASGPRMIRSEDEGFLVIHGRDSEAKAAVSPVNLTGALEKARHFLADPAQTELRLFTVANWKTSVFTGGALTALTLLYMVARAFGGVGPSYRSPSATERASRQRRPR